MNYPESLINAFLSNTKRCDICKEAGIGHTRYSALLKDKEFQNILAERRDIIARESVKAMSLKFLHNIEKLQDIIDSYSSKDQIRINALQLWFNVYGTWFERVEFMSRIERLENALSEQDGTFLGTLGG